MSVKKSNGIVLALEGIILVFLAPSVNDIRFSPKGPFCIKGLIIIYIEPSTLIKESHPLTH